MKSLQCERINYSQVQELPKNTSKDAQPHELSGRRKLGHNKNLSASVEWTQQYSACVNQYCNAQY